MAPAKSPFKQSFLAFTRRALLGDDMGHMREYSEDTSRVIDDEVDRIVREAEEACRELIEANRAALDLVARALLEDETVSGSEVSRLIRVANGTEPDVPRPSTPGTGTTAAPTAGPAQGSPAPGAISTPPPLPPHLQPGGGVARGDTQL